MLRLLQVLQRRMEKILILKETSFFGFNRKQFRPLELSAIAQTRFLALSGAKLVHQNFTEIPFKKEDAQLVLTL